jgi:hypothetical protein
MMDIVWVKNYDKEDLYQDYRLKQNDNKFKDLIRFKLNSRINRRPSLSK